MAVRDHASVSLTSPCFPMCPREVERLPILTHGEGDTLGLVGLVGRVEVGGYLGERKEDSQMDCSCKTL